MEIRHRLLLKHIDSELYVSADPNEFPHTRKITKARRFLDTDQISTFLQCSAYKPERPEEYEIVQLKITYELEDETHANT